MAAVVDIDSGRVDRKHLPYSLNISRVKIFDFSFKTKCLW